MLGRAVVGSRGRPWQHRLLQPVLLVAVLLGLLTMCAPEADAAVSEPVIRCGSEVTWTVAFEALAPTGAADAVAWAYGQVTPVGGLTPQRTDAGRVRFSWADPLSGVTVTEGDTTEESMSSGRYRLHTYRVTGEMSRATLRQQALRAVLRDFGVAAPTSTATGLTRADRRELRRICATTPAIPAEKTGVDGGPVSTDVDSRDADGATNAGERRSLTPQVAPAVTTFVTGVVLVLVTALLAFLVAPTQVVRVAAAARLAAGRLAAKRRASTPDAGEGDR